MECTRTHVVCALNTCNDTLADASVPIALFFLGIGFTTCQLANLVST